MGIVCSDACCTCKCCHCCSWCGWDGPDHEKVTNPEHAINPKWMEQLVEVSPDVTLRGSMILGTHDSGTYDVSSCIPCSSMAKTTRRTVYQQLEVGARYLDIRLGSGGKKANEVRIFHGICGAGQFCSSVNKIDNHLTDVNEFSKNDGEGEESKNLFNHLEI